MEKPNSSNHIKVSAIFDRLCRDVLPDLDAHETMAVVLQHFAVDEVLEALREHCSRMSEEPGDSWHEVAEGIEEIFHAR